VLQSNTGLESFRLLPKRHGKAHEWTQWSATPLVIRLLNTNLLRKKQKKVLPKYGSKYQVRVYNAAGFISLAGRASAAAGAAIAARAVIAE
jgi:hypothetical protein